MSSFIRFGPDPQITIPASGFRQTAHKGLTEDCARSFALVQKLLAKRAATTEGPAVIDAAQTGRTHDRIPQIITRLILCLQNRGRPHMTTPSELTNQATSALLLCVDHIGNVRDEAGLARRNVVGHGVAIGEVTAILRPEGDRRVGE